MLIFPKNIVGSNMRRIALIIISLCLFENIAFSSSYYIDSRSGNDLNKGVNLSKPWRSLKNVNLLQFNAGDSILFKRGSVFDGQLALNLEGKKGALIVVGAYGDMSLPFPQINGAGHKKYTLLLNNPAYCKVSQLEITNNGENRAAGRVGVYIKAEDSGERFDVTLDDLVIRDVNGSLVKEEGAGGGIFWENKGSKVKSRFVGLTIQNCHIVNCGRNGIYSGGYASRDKWYPNLKILISHNLIESVPGDGIVPIGCDGAVIEYNVMRNCPDILSPNEAAAGIWPWSCDNTIIQYNEVSGHNAKWDGQGFDSDYNCQNTVIQYNYSHDNAGGFLLVCNDGNSLGKSWNKGTLKSTVRYNISVNDGIRNYPTKQSGWFTPVVHITGPVKNTMISNNLIIQYPKENDSIDSRMLKMGNWGNKWPENTQFKNNIFYADSGVKSKFDFGGDINTSFIGNSFLGDFKNQPQGTDLAISKKNISKVLQAKSIEAKILRLKKLFDEPEQKYQSFHPGELWLDDQGNHINAHGGGILSYQGKYYWFGEHKSANTSQALVGVRCYSSGDLYHWKNEGVALSVVENNKLSPIAKGCTIERPKVIYNAVTKQFVMYFHLELKGQGYRAAQVGIAISDDVKGPYKFVKSVRPNAGIWPVNMNQDQRTSSLAADDFKEWWTPEWHAAIVNGLFVRRDFEGGQMSRDMTLFVDDDGKAYHIYSSEDNLTIHIAELTNDYLNYTGKYVRLFPGGHNEAPALFKNEGKYYLITSGCTGWAPNAARSAVASSIWGPWKTLGNPCRGEGSESTFSSQSTCIFPVYGEKKSFIFMADRWNPKNHSDGRYVWLPILFENGKPIIKWAKEWDKYVFD